MPRRRGREEPPGERPDPRPQGRPGPMVVVEDGIRLSASRLWRLQRTFFERTDPRAWAKSRVPSYITTNAFMARAHARVLGAFLEDAAAGRLGRVDRAKPIEIVEIGAGSGKLAHGILRDLAAHAGSAARGGLRARYVVTDLARAPVDALRANPRLASFAKAGLLDFAVFDAERPGEIHLLEGGETIRADADANPIAVVASYLFDGIPADLYEVARGELRESHLRLALPEGLDAEDPANLGRFATSFEPGPLAQAPYGDRALDELLQGLAARMADGHFLFPAAGLRLVRHLRALGAGRLLLLAADRGHVHEEALLGLEPPHLERHGSFSLDVNFHAFAEEARLTGGLAMVPSHHPTHLATTAFLWGASDARATRTREAYGNELDAGGPEDLFVLKQTLERQKDRLDVERALAWIRASAWDAEVFHIAAPAILQAIGAAPPSVRLDILDAARHVREGYFPIGEERDVPYALGEVFEALEALPEAEACFALSIEVYGATADALHRRAMTLSALHRLPEALAELEKALALDPSYEPARAMRVALAAERKRRPSP